MAHSTAKQGHGKAEKPRPDFPLFPHATGRWAKKVRGKFHYFGKVADDPDGTAALEQWLADKDELLAGRVPRRKTDANALTLEKLVNKYLATKRGQVDTGEITYRSFWAVFRTCEGIVNHFGPDRRVDDMQPGDFEAFKASMVARKWGPKTINVEITKTRSMFKYGFDAGLIPVPMRFGPGFKNIGKKAERRLNGTRPAKMFEAAEIRKLLDAAGEQLKAMILLGINCAFGNNDLACLPQDAIDMQGGWIDYARTKTGVERRCPLWPETVTAIRQAIAIRAPAADPADNGLVFLTDQGERWVRLIPNPKPEKPPKPYDGITYLARSLLNSQGLKRPGRNFYALRHTFRTVADEALDQVAAGAIMGHVDTSMADVYRQRISDERLRRVADHVRAWLFGQEGGADNG